MQTYHPVYHNLASTNISNIYQNVKMQVTILDTAYFACISVSVVVAVYKAYLLYYLYEISRSKRQSICYNNCYNNLIELKAIY